MKRKNILLYESSALYQEYTSFHTVPYKFLKYLKYLVSPVEDPNKLEKPKDLIGISGHNPNTKEKAECEIFYITENGHDIYVFDIKELFKKVINYNENYLKEKIQILNLDPNGFKNFEKITQSELNRLIDSLDEGYNLFYEIESGEYYELHKG